MPGGNSIPCRTKDDSGPQVLREKRWDGGLGKSGYLGRGLQASDELLACQHTGAARGNTCLAPDTRPTGKPWGVEEAWV